MATWYVYSGAAGAGTGADWANAKTTLSAAITAGAAGDTYYIAKDHSETSGTTILLTVKGTISSPDRFLCVNRAGSVPPVAADLTTGAVLFSSGSSSSGVFTIQNGCAYFYGLQFKCGTGSSTCDLTVTPLTTSRMYFENCIFQLFNPGTGSRIRLNNTFVAHNCNFWFGNVQQAIVPGLDTTIRNTSSALTSGSTAIPTTLFQSISSGGRLTLDGLDLSAQGSGNTIIQAATSLANRVLINNCKLNASVTITGAPTCAYTTIDVVGSDSGTSLARNERYMWQANLTTETTIKRTNGATDGTTSFSWKVVPNANNKTDTPFETFEGALWNSSTGSSKTLKIHTVTDNVTLKDDEIWVEVEYLGSSSTPVASYVSDRAATVLTTGANQATSTETWTTTGLTTPVYQQLDVTFTPQMAGPVRWKVLYAKTSGTVYICPKAELS